MRHVSRPPHRRAVPCDGAAAENHLTRRSGVDPWTSRQGLRIRRRCREASSCRRRAAGQGLVVPPAWQDVWVTPFGNGHLQAVGTDVAGRRQYLYHPAWREKRDELKHDRVLKIARRLPAGRLAVLEQLRTEGMSYERALATAFRLLDLGYFRVGSDSYADANGSYGLTTLGRRHVRRVGKALVFEFVAKSGVEQHIEVTDPDVAARWTSCADDTARSRRFSCTRSRAARPGSTPPRSTSSCAGCSATTCRPRISGPGTAPCTRPSPWRDVRRRRSANARAPSRPRCAMWPSSSVTRRRSRASYVDPRLIDLYQDG